MGVALRQDPGAGLDEGEHELGAAQFVLLADVDPRRAQQPDHGGVAVEGVGHEPVDAVGDRPLGQRLEQGAPDAAALPGVADHERHLGSQRVVQHLVATHAHDAVVGDGHQRLAAVVVDVGEVVHLGLGEVRVGREVATLLGVLRQGLVELDEARRVSPGSMGLMPMSPTVGSVVTATIIPHGGGMTRVGRPDPVRRSRGRGTARGSAATGRRRPRTPRPG